MVRIFNFFALFCLLIVGTYVSAQTKENRWEKSILKFEEQDKQNPPNKKKLIVFTGSSSMVLWESLKEDFPNKNVLNRGFGGSQTSDLIYYLDRAVNVYKPIQVFVYEGDNDIADSKKSPEKVLEDFTTVFNRLRAANKKVHIGFISIKPSPIRVKYTDEIIKANALVKDFISKQKNAVYIDIYSKMVDADGKPKPELYLPDRLHMAPSAYKIWVDAVRPHLK